MSFSRGGGSSSRLAAAAILAAAMAGSAAPLCAQAPVTVERIFGSDDFRTSRVALDWMPDGEGFLTIERAETGSGSDLWIEGIRTGSRTRLVEGTALASSDTASLPVVASVEWSPDGSRMLLFTDAQQVWREATRGTFLVYEPGTGRLTSVSSRRGEQMFAKFSPDGGRVGFVRENDLYVTDLATGVETRLTTDGSDLIINGTTDWVYEEELGLRDAWRWSPDGKRIAFWRFDQSPIETFYMIDESSLYSEPIPLRYPKAGTANSG